SVLTGRVVTGTDLPKQRGYLSIGSIVASVGEFVVVIGERIEGNRLGTGLAFPPVFIFALIVFRSDVVELIVLEIMRHDYSLYSLTPRRPLSIYFGSGKVGTGK